MKYQYINLVLKKENVLIIFVIIWMGGDIIVKDLIQVNDLLKDLNYDFTDKEKIVFIK